MKIKKSIVSFVVVLLFTATCFQWSAYASIEDIVDGNLDGDYGSISHQNMLNSLIYKDEIRAGSLFAYKYEGFRLIGFTYQGEEYSYLRDDSDSVVGIVDSANQEVARYNYNLKTYEVTILGLNDENEWVKMNSDENFIGNINLVRLNGLRYNEDKDYYELDGVIYDPKAEAAQKLSLNAMYKYEDILNPTNSNKPQGSESPIKPKTIAPVLLYADLYQVKASYSNTSLGRQVDLYANTLIASANFRRHISYSKGWFASLSEVEILARLIYGENTSVAEDQRAITWVVLNRHRNKGYPSTLKGVATQSGQFATITGNSDNTKRAREPAQGAGWKTAIWYACAITTTTNHTDCRSLFGKPNGISNQLFFTASTYFYTNCKNRTGGLQYRMDGKWVDVKQVRMVSYDEEIKTKATVKDEQSLSFNIFFNLAN